MSEIYELPKTFTWLSPWHPIEDERSHPGLRGASSEEPSLVKELEREMPQGHVLSGLSLKAIAYCSADPEEFLFLSNDPKKPIACVHLTWKKETNPQWPHTDIYESAEEWLAQMKREHEGNAT